MKRNIFEDSDPEENEDKTADIEINQGYAKRFEHNKKREALQRLEELKKKGLASEESSEDDDDDFEEEDVVAGSSKTDLQFYDALIKVKKKDPLIQQKDAKLYSDDDEEEEEEEERRRWRNEKPLYIKDVVAMQLLEDGPDFDVVPEKVRESQSKVYSKEQEENLKAFLEVADDAAGDGDDDDDDDELFEKKKRKGGDEDGGDLEIKKKVDEFWGDDGVLDQNELFLKNFFSKKMWVDKSKADEKPWGVGDIDVISDDEEALEKQEKYEAEYNFRYEEGAGDRVLGHARHIDGSVRKKKNARKTQRKNKEERMVQAEFERKEELKHLKNLKKKEIEERLEKIRAIAGIRDGNVCKLTEDDLEEEFNPEEYDRKMKETFSMDYYDADDVDPGFGSGADDDLEKPDFDKEDELLGLPKDWDVIETGAGFKAARERSLKHKAKEEKMEDVAEEEKMEDVAEEEDQQYESKRKRKRKITLREKVELEKELEEYYKLDYEDTIGDLRTRFKYKSVPSNRYGLNAAEILMADDKELNQYVSIKKLAPYVQEEWKVPRMKRYQMKVKKMLGEEEKSNGDKIDKKHHAKHSAYTESKSKTQQDVSTEEAPVEEPPSKRSKRRRRQAEIKLSHSRLLAYGKILPNPKKQKKHKH